MDISNKVIAITGGAQGLGRAMALHLADKGSHIALVDMNEALLEETVQAVEAKGVKALGYRCNVTDEQSVEETFARIATDFGSLNGLINSAGILRDGLFVKVRDGKEKKKMTLEQFQSVIDVNLTGTFLCAREAAVHMVNNGWQGVIINMSSVARAGNIGQTNYSASKAGVVAMTVCWARELGKYGIRVGAIAPGVIKTAMTDAMKPEARARLEKMKPVGRLGQPEEIAHAAAFILENDFFTGRVLEVDGGIAF